MVNAAQFGFVAPFIVELYFQGWNVRCTCALFKLHVYPCHEITSSELTQLGGIQVVINLCRCDQY